MSEIGTNSLTLNDPPQPKPKRLLVKWSLLAAALLLAYFMWQCGTGLKAGAQLSDPAVRHFHSQLDSKAYDDIVSESDEAFQNSGSHDDLVKFLDGVHSKLGLSHDFSRTNIFVSATTNGTFIKVTYQSAFEEGKAIETFTFRKTGSSLKLVRYDINSPVFVTR